MEFYSSVIVMPGCVHMCSSVRAHGNAANIRTCTARDFHWGLIVYGRVANPVWRGIVNRPGNVNHVSQSIPR